MDCPWDYPVWVPPLAFEYDPTRSNLRALATILSLQSLGLRDPGRVDELVAPVLTAQERRRQLRIKALAKARTDLLRGKRPSCPPWLHAAQRSEERAVLRIIDRLGPRHGDAAEFVGRFIAQGREHVESMRLSAKLVEDARETPHESIAMELHRVTCRLALEFTTTVTKLLLTASDER